MLKRFSYLLLFASASCFGALLFLHRKFGSVSLSAVLSTLANPNITFDHIPSYFLGAVIRYTLIGPLCIVLLFLLIQQCFQKCIPRYSSLFFSLLYFLLIAFFTLGFLVEYKNCFELDNNMARLADELKRKYGNIDFFKKLYVPPEKDRILHSEKMPARNIIVLYVESLERSYSNHALFHDNLLQALDTKNIPYQDLPRLVQVSGTGWSMAGIVASQCGIPLVIRLGQLQNTIGRMSSDFLPGATCLSDIFSLQHYKTVFLKNASLAFSEMDVFLRTHHTELARGFEYWQSKGYRKTNNGWGIDDDTLFLEAKKMLSSALHKRQPLYLFMLTVNTHGSNGTVDSYCRQNGVHDFRGIVRCAAEETRDFLEFVFRHDPNAIVLVTGDHLAMKNPVSPLLESQQKRYVFTRIYGRNLPKIQTQHSTHFDIFPLILHASGFTIPNGMLGLGIDPFQINQINHTERLALLNYIGQINSPSYNRLWVPPKNLERQQQAVG